VNEYRRSAHTLGVQLRKRREELKLPLRQVADLSGDAVSAAGLSRIETGSRYPTLKTLEALATVYGVTFTIDPKQTVLSGGRSD
jgi:transcriptional regulator with XRE-family HTH domain